MIRLPTAAVTALRNRLRERGARPSLSLPVGSADEMLETQIVEQYGALCEAMYLLMAADGQITGAERDVIRGALRELDDRIRSRHVESMLATSAEALVRDGWTARMQAIGDAIGDDPVRAEAAILLAAAVAYADGEIAPEENNVMSGLMQVLNVSADRTRELIGSLERVDEVLQRDEKVDAADIVVHAALRLRTPEDFERLAATTDRPDVTLALRLYAAYVRSCDDLMDRSAAPRSIPTARVEALRLLADEMPPERSPRLDELRSALTRVAQALQRVDDATSLRALLDEKTGTPALAALESSIAGLSQLVSRALDRLGHPVSPAALDLRHAIGDVVRNAPRARDILLETIDRALTALAPTIPGGLLSAFDSVLRHVATLPTELAGQAAEKQAVVEDDGLPEWLPKSRFLGGWFVHKTLGGGGSGSVFVASRAGEHDDPEAERFALKVPLYDAVAARSVSEAEYLSVFRREAGALLALPDHQNLAGFVTFDAKARPKPVLVMELVQGVDCQELLQRHRDGRGGLDVARVCTILDGVLAGLAAMHEVEIGHLDVKPGNVVLRPSGEAVLVDFGLSGRHIRLNCATPTYAAPEIWGHNEDEGPAFPFPADMYAFGCVAYELFTGKPLFAEPHILALLSAHMSHDGGPEEVQKLVQNPRTAPIGALISACMRKSQKARATAEQLRAELKKVAPRVASLPWPIA